MDKHQKKNKHVEDHTKHKTKFHAVSMVLAVTNTITLDKGVLRFSNGMVEGKGISINSNGDVITFEEEGSYRFEICGDAVIYSDVDAKLVYYSDKFSSEISKFSETNIPRQGNKLSLRAIPMILPMKSNQTIVVKIVPLKEESIIVLEGTRLLIHRVA
jgi:hypothetical protein